MRLQVLTYKSVPRRACLFTQPQGAQDPNLECLWFLYIYGVGHVGTYLLSGYLDVV